MGNAWAGKATPTQQSIQDIFGSYSGALPNVLGAVTKGQTAADLAAARSAAATTPIYSQAGLGNLQQFGVPYAQAGAAASGAAQEAGAQTQANILNQYATPEAQTYRAALQAANPEYFSTLGTATNQLNNLVNSINLNGLSGSERAEVERSLGQSQTATGNLGLDNATNAVSNAMNFGSALQAKRTALGQALQTATGMMGTQQTGYNPMSPLTNANQNNLGTSNFQGVTPSGNQAWNFAGGALGNATSIGTASQANQYSSAMRSSPMGIGESISGQVGSVCCFIFMEAYSGKLPDSVRYCRDAFYDVNPLLADGYRRMAKWLVPAMRSSGLIRQLVNRFMIKPLTEYGEWLCGNNNDGYRYRQYVSFWFRIWKKG